MNATESIRALIAKAARLADGQPIKHLHVLLGELTGLTPAEVQTVFFRERVGTVASRATLDLRLEPGRAVCQTCETEWAAQALGEACEACGSGRTHMVAGHRLHLASLTFDGQARERAQVGWRGTRAAKVSAAASSGIQSRAKAEPRQPPAA